MSQNPPLAARMRPLTLDEFVGQNHIVGHGSLLYRAIKADKLRSIILYGPPGTGKTTLAQIIAHTTASSFVQLNATTSGIKDIKETVESAKSLLLLTRSRTILFIDEIHRFNKTQQDALLPHVEDGTVILIGATTENPYFEVNKALVSRSLIFELKKLTQSDIRSLLARSLSSPNGFPAQTVRAEDTALDFLSEIADGDARCALNALELAVLTTDPTDGEIVITPNIARECVQKRPLNYEKDGDNHYDTVSAFIKSMRASDPDAAVYYLARMIHAGESPRFIARRILICAAEDVGNADPHALMVASSAAYAADFVGFPEAAIILSQAAAYISCAPKSNAAVNAVYSALADVENVSIKNIPNYLRDAHYPGAAALGHGADYVYTHNLPGHYTTESFLPEELRGKTYYNPDGLGVEKKIKEFLDKKRGK
ncbi:ATPase AAA [Clostridia bacterium]|nr:ATPase AAA [Clostridia bacterium]